VEGGGGEVLEEAATGRTVRASMVVEPAVPMSQTYSPPESLLPGRKWSSTLPTAAPSSSPPESSATARRCWGRSPDFSCLARML